MAQTNVTELTAQLRMVHHNKYALCDRLEEIADALPNNINKHFCTTTAQAIEPILSKAHRFEEQELYPAICRLHEGVVDQAKVFERLRSEHYEDRCFGEEVREVLMSYGEGKPIQAANATGYMLRGFFENLRRHMAFEAELARPLRLNIKTASNFSPDAAE